MTPLPVLECQRAAVGLLTALVAGLREGRVERDLSVAFAADVNAVLADLWSGLSTPAPVEEGRALGESLGAILGFVVHIAATVLVTCCPEEQAEAFLQAVGASLADQVIG